VLISSNTSGVTPGVYGDSTHVSQVTVSEYGRITNAAAIPISYPNTGSITSSTLAVSGTPPVYTLNLNSGIATPGTYGSNVLIPSITCDTYGRITNITTIAPKHYLYIYFTTDTHQSGSGVYIGTGNFNATQTIISTPCPVTGTVTEIFSSITNTQASNVTNTLYINGSTSGQLATITTGNLQGTTAVSIAVSKNDRFAILISTPGVVNGYMSWIKIEF
jgi:hypothetical protein